MVVMKPAVAELAMAFVAATFATAAAQMARKP
jgi:hypothetical protein